MQLPHPTPIETLPFRTNIGTILGGEFTLNNKHLLCEEPPFELSGFTERLPHIHVNSLARIAIATFEFGEEVPNQAPWNKGIKQLNYLLPGVKNVLSKMALSANGEFHALVLDARRDTETGFISDYRKLQVIVNHEQDDPESIDYYGHRHEKIVLHSEEEIATQTAAIAKDTKSFIEHAMGLK